jgi:hypothetical protein
MPRAGTQSACQLFVSRRRADRAVSRGSACAADPSARSKASGQKHGNMNLFPSPSARVLESHRPWARDFFVLPAGEMPIGSPVIVFLFSYQG